MNATDINISDLPTIPLSKRRNLPNCSAVYFVMQGDTTLYIGQTQNLYRRWFGHHIWEHLYRFDKELQIAWLECSQPELLPEIEKAMIVHFKPLLNRRDLTNEQPKKFSITVPDSVFKDLETLAEHQGRPTASLASFLVEMGIHIYKERGEFPKQESGKEQKK